MSIRGDIIDDIKDAIESITVANGYNQDIKYVSTDSIELPDTLHVTNFPAVFVIDTEETKSPSDVDTVECALTLVLLCYMRRKDNRENLQDKRRKMTSDIEKAIMADERRELKALKTDITRIETDRGIDDNNAITEITCVVTYYHDRDNPSAQDNNLE